MDTNTRRPRFQRSTPRSIHLTDRDLAILKIVYHYRFSTSDMIREAITGSPQVITKRLTELYHSRHLDRPREQLPSYQQGGKPIIYALGNKGADVLTMQEGIDRKKIDWTTKNREAGERYLQHALMVAQFRHALTLALRDRPQTDLHFWEHAGAFKVKVSYTDRDGREIDTTIVPDAYFALTDADATMYFFLECDRSTMTNDRFSQKLKGYYEFWKQHIKKQPDNPFGIPSFRVLTITKSEQRKENLRALAKTVDDQQRGSRFFWFLCEKNYLIPHPLNLFENWQIAKDDAYHHLLTEEHHPHAR